MSHGKVMIIRLIVGLSRKMLLNEILLNKILLNKILLNEFLLNKILSNPLHKTSQYFPKPYDRFGGNVKAKLKQICLIIQQKLISKEQRS